MKAEEYEKCDSCINGCCYAYVCFTGTKCEAKQGKPEPVCMATIKEIEKFNQTQQQ